MTLDQSSNSQDMIEVIDAARRRTLVPLIGAGISRQTGQRFPTWRELLEIMLAHALAQRPPYVSSADATEMKQLLDRGKFLMVAEELRVKFPKGEYKRLFRDTFTRDDVAPAPIHKELFYLNAPLILTTNYDKLIEEGYAEECGLTLTPKTYKQAAEIQDFLTKGGGLKDRPLLFKIHGTVSNVDEIIFTEMDYRDLAYKELGYRAVLSAIFLTRTVLMLGFSLSDREFTSMLESLRHTLDYNSLPHYILMEEQKVGDLEARRLRDDYGIVVISYESSPDHQGVFEFVNRIVHEVNPERVIHSRRPADAGGSSQ